MAQLLHIRWLLRFARAEKLNSTLGIVSCPSLSGGDYDLDRNQDGPSTLLRLIVIQNAGHSSLLDREGEGTGPHKVKQETADSLRAEAGFEPSRGEETRMASLSLDFWVPHQQVCDWVSIR